MTRLVLLLCVLAACKKSSPERDEDPGPEHLESLTPAAITTFTDHALDVYDALATAGERDGDDCGQLATDLSEILDREGDTLQEAVRQSSDPAFQAAAHDILEARNERTRALTVRMETAFESCAEDPDVAELLQQIE